MGSRSFGWAAAVGQIAFTNYIIQSLALGFIFYRYELGVFGKLDQIVGLGIVLLVYVLQVIRSRIWLRCFR